MELRAKGPERALADGPAHPGHELVVVVQVVQRVQPRAQHLAHKIFFSVLAWLAFALLLIGRYHWHWRGRRAVRFLVAGFGLLAVGFFGSKIVLELVLHSA